MHRRIGILGGLSPESTVTYYEEITRGYAERYGDFSYPEILIYSVNFQKYVDWQKGSAWGEAARDMSRCLQNLKRAGADFGLIATNTMHIVFDEVQAAVDLPLISIVDATATAIQQQGLKTVGLLGTIFTMREPFYRDGLARQGIEVQAPARADQEIINGVIYHELCRGEIRPESREQLRQIIGNLRASGAEGIVLGCTEIPLLIQPEHSDLPLFNTTVLHAREALDYAVAADDGKTKTE